jgi:hypothetical protein
VNPYQDNIATFRVLLGGYHGAAAIHRGSSQQRSCTHLPSPVRGLQLGRRP